MNDQSVIELNAEQIDHVVGGIAPALIVAGVVATWLLYEYGDDVLEGAIDAWDAYFG